MEVQSELFGDDDRHIVAECTLTQHLDLSISKLEARMISYGERTKHLLFFLAVAFVIFITFAIFGNQIAILTGIIEYLPQKTSLISFGLSLYCLIGIGAGYIVRSSTLSRHRRDLNEAIAKKRILSRTIVSDHHGEETYFDRLVEINISNLEAYYRMVKDHM